MHFLYVILLLFLSISLTSRAHAGRKADFNSFSVYMENDGFAGKDRGYTSGLKLSLSTPFVIEQSDGSLPRWSYPIVNRLPFMSDRDKASALSLSLGQNIYTPDDKTESDVVKDDRPYAGITYMGIGFHRKTERRQDTWEFIIGILGPHSYADDIQKWVHDITNSQSANGWDNQLRDELIIEATYETRWCLVAWESGSGYRLEFIPHLGGHIGNWEIYGNAGFEARYGWNVSNDVGTCPIRNGCASNISFDDGRSDFDHAGRTGIYFFTALDGRAVLQDITLDGNTFEDSPSVDKEYFVADLMAGIALHYGNIKMSYSYVFRTREFKTQNYDTIFGSLNISYSF